MKRTMQAFAAATALFSALLTAPAAADDTNRQGTNWLAMSSREKIVTLDMILSGFQTGYERAEYNSGKNLKDEEFSQPEEYYIARIDHFYASGPAARAVPIGFALECLHDHANPLACPLAIKEFSENP